MAVAAVQPTPDLKPDSGKTPNPQLNEPNPQKKVEPAPKPGDAKPAPAREGSIYQDLGVDPPGEHGATTFPDNWREQLATGDDGKIDEAELKRLQRYQSPQAYNKSTKEAARRLRSGEFKRGKPEGDDPAQLAAWRTEQGIPDKPEGYEFPIPGGVTFDKLDPETQENLKGFQQAFHEAELAGPQAVKVSQAIINIAEKSMAAEATKDAQAMETTEDTLRADWGPDYRDNLKISEAHGLKVFGDDFYAICKSRLPDGRRLGDLPQFHKYMAEQGRLDGSDEHIGGDGGGKGGTLEGRRQELENIMNTDNARYYREGHNVEYRQVLEKLEAKGKLPDPVKRS